MLPYTAVDMITTMDRTFGFEDCAPDTTSERIPQALRRSREMLLAAAITLIGTARR